MAFSLRPYKLKLDEEKSKQQKSCGGSTKWFWPSVFALFAEASSMHSKV
jgi:hypothetical protein